MQSRAADEFEWDGAAGDIARENFEFQRQFNKQLAKKGWIAPAWPKQYGGLGASHIEQMIFSEELAYRRAPNGQRVFSVGMIGPTLIVHGSEEQKAEHLPRITSGESAWCQGYSEPGAGSDLAALQTRAEHDGDDYVINGQKIWTTGAHVSDWMFMVARTDPEAPKHKGISFLLVDMKSPGITVRPLINLADRHEFNEVFLEDVRVPRRNLVGAENNGWYVAMTLLDFERSSVGVSASGRRTLEEITAFADFPEAHWRKVWSTNPLERLNREVKRRTDVVGIFPNPAALLRLSTCVLIEAHDEWQVAERRYLSEASMAQLNPPAPTSSSSTRRARGGDFYLATCGDFLMATDKPGGPPKAEPGRGAPRSGGALIRKSRVRQLSGGPQTRCRGGRW